MQYPCLVLDHDDTVVKSTAQIHYPAFLHTLSILRPDVSITLEAFTEGCATPGFIELCTNAYHFTKEELDFELQDWLTFVKEKIPDTHEGFQELLATYRKAGGKIYVVSQSDATLIQRDYEHHFGFLPDGIYDLNFAPQKPDPAPIIDIISTTGFAKEQILVVDDLPAGRDMASAAGVDFLYAGWSQTAGSIDRTMRNSCYTVNHVNNLKKILL